MVKVIKRKGKENEGTVSKMSKMSLGVTDATSMTWKMDRGRDRNRYPQTMAFATTKNL